MALYGKRGVMLDLARNMERKRYYFGLLPQLAAWGYNLVHLHLTDDQGCALEFPSHPELATKHAFTVEEMKRFVAEADALGIEVVVEIEALGHTRFITENRRYRALGEKSEHRAGFHAICPSHPQTRVILRDLVRDAAEIFPSPILHAGLDEVQFGKCPRCRRRFGKKADWQKFAEHAAWVHAEIRRAGKRPAMWGDHILHDRGMIGRFKKDVLIFDWHYEPSFPPSTVEFFLDHGHEVLAAPATVCWRTRVHPNEENLANLRTAAARLVGLRRRGLLGLVNTVWCPHRNLPGAIDYGLALAGHLFTERAESPEFPERFAREFYGLRSGRAAGGAIARLHALALSRELVETIAYGGWNKLRFNREDARLAAAAEPPLAEVVAALKRVQRSVRRNAGRFGDVVLSAEILLALARFGVAGRRRAAARPFARLYARALGAWKRNRWPDDPCRFGAKEHNSRQSLLYLLRTLARRA